ncbi:unnamed protein product [Caenorhabditis angaria]|uniref:CC domain-containing protein n=1 Tax=Caenorhabditis angaria TaxID=860376 RepID=A0A9P1NCF1_9PELO|nr:unnamed protein product [Caenorhabditis angaria]
MFVKTFLVVIFCAFIQSCLAGGYACLDGVPGRECQPGEICVRHDFGQGVYRGISFFQNHLNTCCLVT